MTSDDSKAAMLAALRSAIATVEAEAEPAAVLVAVAVPTEGGIAVEGEAIGSDLGCGCSLDALARVVERLEENGELLDDDERRLN